jgi:hypothetical protein
MTRLVCICVETHDELLQCLQEYIFVRRQSVNDEKAAKARVDVRCKKGRGLCEQEILSSKGMSSRVPCISDRVCWIFLFQHAFVAWSLACLALLASPENVKNPKGSLLHFSAILYRM